MDFKNDSKWFTQPVRHKIKPFNDKNIKGAATHRMTAPWPVGSKKLLVSFAAK